MVRAIHRLTQLCLDVEYVIVFMIRKEVWQIM